MNKPHTSTLQLLWPKDNWATLINDERPDELLDILTKAYESIRPNPRSNQEPVTNAQWQDSYATSIAILRALFRKTKTIEQAKQLNQRFCERFGLDYETIDSMPIQKSYIYWTISQKELDGLSRDAIVIDSIQDKSKSSATSADLKGNVDIPSHFAKALEVKDRFGPAIANFSGDINQSRREFLFKQILVQGTGSDDFTIHHKNAYEAFCDMADALEIPRKWIGMNTLTLFIGNETTGDSGNKSDMIIINPSESLQPLAKLWFKCIDSRIANSIAANMETTETYVSQMLYEDLQGNHTTKTRAIYQIIRKLTLLPIGEGGSLDRTERLADGFTSFVADCLSKLSRYNYLLTGHPQHKATQLSARTDDLKASHNLYKALFLTIKNPELTPNLTESQNI